MCGIAGIWGDPSPDRLRVMADRLCHRGPDDQGYWCDSDRHIGFAHRRLSVIDLETGHQPITNEDGRVVTVFNGEIYNYRELRGELIQRGHRFATDGDSEVIVHLYEDLGVEAVHRLRGMFAMAIWDSAQEQLVLFRDRIGQKPLYYSERGNEFAFASEIKSLLAIGNASPAIDTQALYDYLIWGAIHAPSTVYQSIRSVEPAEMLVIRNRRVTRRERYWRVTMSPKVMVSRAEAVDCIDQQLRESIRMRLRADVPVGAFLSGGIDSGLVTAIAVGEYNQPLTTVTVGFADGQFDERSLARQVARRFATDHHDVLITPDIVEDLSTIAACYDQPFADSSAVPSYYVAREARQFSKVVLNGDGGDELFAGYRKFVGARLLETLAWANHARCRSIWQRLHQVLPAPRRFRSMYQFLYRLVHGLSLAPSDCYVSWTANYFSMSALKCACQVSDAQSGQSGASGSWMDPLQPATRLVDRFSAELAGTDRVDWMLGADLLTSLPHDLLVKMDIACMAHGLEARSPFLDHVLVDTVTKFSSGIKVGWRTTKPLLRALAKRYLPFDVQRAPKRGFEIPVVRWLRIDLRQMARDVLLTRNGLLASLFKRQHIERLVHEEDGQDPSHWARCVWALLMLGIWDAEVRPTSCRSQTMCQH